MILRKVRAVPIINGIIRQLLIRGSQFFFWVQRRWRISGEIDLRFENITFKYFSKADDSIVDIFFYRHKYPEDADVSVFLKAATKAEVVFDIGANTGLFTVLGARLNSKASFYSFEPHPANYRRLLTNINLNNLTNVEAIDAALGDQVSSIDFFIPEAENITDTSSVLKNFSESTYAGKVAWKPIRVKQMSVDFFAETKSLRRIDLMKIDVEGYEISVLEGCKNILEKFQPLIICEIFLNDEKAAYFRQFVSKYHYTAYMILAEGLVRLDEELIQNVNGLNYLFSAIRTDKVFIPLKDVHLLIKSGGNV
jgi:FkbM family methyltransferase